MNILSEFIGLVNPRMAFVYFILFYFILSTFYF